MNVELEQTSPWYLYILLCADGSLYTGVATDLERRLHEHNHTAAGARYTRPRRPVRLAYFEEVSSRSAACRREYEVKQLSARQKVALILAADPAPQRAGGVEAKTLAALRQAGG
ncbi:GIY-YIG nuclease family protein [Pseudomonadota bacterium]